MNLTEVLYLIAAQVGADGSELIQYAAEDDLGGYHNIPSLARWPGGSIWESEGKILYALTRWLKPDIIGDLGGMTGCSASHFAKACQENGKGRVFSIDNGRAGATHGERIPGYLREYVELVAADGLDWLRETGDGSIGIVLEDMMHDTPSVKIAAELSMLKLQPGGLLLNHDAGHTFAWAGNSTNKVGSSVGAEVQAGLRQAGLTDFIVYLTDESDCGISVLRKANIQKWVEPKINGDDEPLAKEESEPAPVETLQDHFSEPVKEPEKVVKRKPGRKSKNPKTE